MQFHNIYNSQYNNSNMNGNTIVIKFSFFLSFFFFFLRYFLIGSGRNISETILLKNDDSIFSDHVNKN